MYTIPNDIEPHLASLINGLLHINKQLRLTLEQIKEHDWFRRRPPRTFEYLPFPPFALNRFQTFTMHDYLTELHQPANLSENNHHEIEQLPISNGTNSVDENQSDQQREHYGRSTLNCNCSRTISGENIPQIKTRNKQQPRICSLS